jgi:signal transduction histidine kinase
MIIELNHEEANIINLLRVHVNPIYNEIGQSTNDLEAFEERVTVIDLEGVILSTNHPEYKVLDQLDLMEDLYHDHVYDMTSGTWHKLSLPLYDDSLVIGFVIFEVDEVLLNIKDNNIDYLWYSLILLFIIFSACLVFYQPQKEIHMLLSALDKLSKGVFIPLDISENSQYHQLFSQFNKVVDDMVYMMKRHDLEEQKQKEFLTIISHELKTPIATINAYVEGLILGIAKGEDSKIEYQKIIHEQMQYLMIQVEGLFEYAQDNSDRFKYHFEELYADDCFKKIFDHLPQDERIQIDNMLPPCVINIDVVRIEQVIMNLYNNAVKHTNCKDHIQLTAYRQNQEIIIEVKDKGDGIDSKDLPHIFEFYYQGSKSQKGDYQGVGLGLAISKEIVNKHHGSIKVKSSQTDGTCFIISLPIL